MRRRLDLAMRGQSATDGGSPSWRRGRAGSSRMRSFARSASAPRRSTGGSAQAGCIDSIAASTPSDTRRWGGGEAMGGGARARARRGAEPRERGRGWDLMRAPGAVDPRDRRGRRPQAARRASGVHRTRALPPGEVTTLRRAPRSRRPRARSWTSRRAGYATARSSASSTERSCSASWTSRELRAMCRRRPGSASLNAVLSRYAAGPVDTRSRLEEIVVRALRRARSAAAERQHRH